ncbi:MAG: Lipoprotein signal peptidase [Tenericutes bacterium ADurb.Bin239]|jgi:signal peptidase II|nr:MAG: Lipoprotein signal peptidase [Tenericutes bacterium ADurb.Bin239]
MDKVKKFFKSCFYSYAWLAIVLLIVDQLTKLWALKAAWDLTLIPNFLHLTYVRNTGAAWSMFDGNMTLLAVVSAVVGVAIIVARILYRHKLNAFKKILFAVILAGTWGNFIDRAFSKLVTGEEGVIDFIHFQFGRYHFPVFNVADICITLGILTYLVYLFREEYVMVKKPKGAKQTNAEIKEEDDASNTN